MPINPLISGLLWAAYLFCLLLSGVQSPYPATGVVPNVTPTGTTGDSYFITMSIWGIEPLDTSAWAPYTKIYPFTNFDTVTNNIVAYDRGLTRRLTISTGTSGIQWAVIKDSLTLGVGQRWGTNKLFYTISVSGGILSASLASQGSTGVNAKAMHNSTFADQVVAADNSLIYRITVSTYAVTGSVALDGTRNIEGLDELVSSNAYLVGRDGNTAPILARANFATIKNPAISDSEKPEFYCVDNLDNKIKFIFDAMNRITRFNTDTWLLVTDYTHPKLSLAVYGVDNNILNFGPYQYVVTIPQQRRPTIVIFVIKSNLVINGTYSFDAKVPRYSPHRGILQQEGENYPFVIFDLEFRNFQSYYLTVADCTSRDASNICQTCTANSDRADITPFNICIPPEYFWPNYGIDAANNAQAPCTGNGAGAGCLSCLDDYTQCKTCDVGTSYYKLNGACYLYSAIPDGYGIITTGQQNLGACVDANCKKCSANYQICTECDQANGYILVNGSCPIQVYLT